MILWFNLQPVQEHKEILGVYDSDEIIIIKKNMPLIITMMTLRHELIHYFNDKITEKLCNKRFHLGWAYIKTVNNYLLFEETIGKIITNYYWRRRR